jgi:hypothetical protein
MNCSQIHSKRPDPGWQEYPKGRPLLCAGLSVLARRSTCWHGCTRIWGLNSPGCRLTCQDLSSGRSVLFVKLVAMQRGVSLSGKAASDDGPRAYQNTTWGSEPSTVTLHHATSYIHASTFGTQLDNCDTHLQVLQACMISTMYPTMLETAYLHRGSDAHASCCLLHGSHTLLPKETVTAWSSEVLARL